MIGQYRPCLSEIPVVQYHRNASNVPKRNASSSRVAGNQPFDDDVLTPRVSHDLFLVGFQIAGDGAVTQGLI